MIIPRMMAGQNVMWPALLKGIKNWIQANMIVRPNLDPKFRLSKFSLGARQAFLTVSERIADGKVDSLQGLVTKEVLDSVKKATSSLSMADHELFRRQDSDIYLCFPYELGIIFEDNDPLKRWVEVMMVFHTLQGFEALQKDNVSVTDIQKKPIANKFLFANFKFSRNYSKGVKLEDSDWTINYINYFTPEGDFEEEKKKHEASSPPSSSSSST
ncbi:hypothetical protein BV898_04413 [Hypsibius exemplaris]|uniref:Uncharacterized protein n=1 Tax=Hypsibius exemplaris TaxID=2072580 RepID=A0A1W0X267_HYPEX|nr:hypothetical protein BV898_04413 [Hypsibius exemplaris]